MILPKEIGFWIKVVVSVFAVATYLIFSQVGDMNHRIEWFKALGAIGTPVMVAFGLWFTKEALEVNRGMLQQTRKTVDNATSQLEIERQSKTSDLFFRASEQLGDDKSDSQRIAALYMLERISQTYPDYYLQTIQVICAFVRNRSDSRASTMSPALKNFSNYRTSDELTVAAEILGRRKHRYLEGEDIQLDLSGADFSGVTFKEVDFEGANFKDATFINAVVHGSNFSFCDFNGSNMRGSNWLDTYLVCTHCINLNGLPESLSLNGITFTKNPLGVVRSLKPHTLSLLLPIGQNQIKQPELVPSSFLIAGGTLPQEVKEFVQAQRDMVIWKYFLQQENQRNPEGWWWEVEGDESGEMSGQWVRYRARYDSYQWGVDEGPIEE